MTQLITVERHHAVEIRMGGNRVLPVASHQPIDVGVGIRRPQGTQEGNSAADVAQGTGPNQQNAFRRIGHISDSTATKPPFTLTEAARRMMIPYS